MSERWYKEAVIYCLEVETFQDSDGDGYGDLRGLTSRLDYLARLGVTCLWLNPIHPSPHRDAGYDVADYYAVDERLGSLGDFVELTRQADQRGIRILLDLVVNHTSSEHPWFRSARSSPQSPYRDWYVWSPDEPPDRHQGVVFPGEQHETWTWDETAGAWYFHRFYDFQPDLNWANHEVREEVKKVMGFWLQLGASGFRIDAAPFVLEQVSPGHSGDRRLDFSILDDWRQDLQWRQRDAVLLCEANVDAEELPQYCTSSSGGPNDRAHMLFAFTVNPFLWLALARRQAEPVVTALAACPRLPAMAQWATFLRNHDELDLEPAHQRAAGRRLRRVRAATADAPVRQGNPSTAVADAGRRPGADRAGLLAPAQHAGHAGAAVRRGDRHGGQPQASRAGSRSGRRCSGSPAARRASPRGRRGRSAARCCAGRGARAGANVREQQRDPGSLLRWFEQVIRTLAGVPRGGHRRVHRCSISTSRRPCWPTASTPRRARSCSCTTWVPSLSGWTSAVRPSGGRPPSTCSPTGRTTRRACSSRASSCGRGAIRWLRLRRGRSV